jgi:nitroimidazol reductase NimA-like FMN-containing flavoprotein (pyridoxamine 5'-phosphate oxidase superfamily)
MMLVSAKTEQYLRDVVIPLRLSCIAASRWPVVLSLWYLYHDERLYCATQETARVVGYLRHEPRCAFEIAADHPPYCGVRGQGMATIDTTSGIEILEQLLVRYLGSTETQLGKRLLAQSHNEVAIVIEPVKVFTWNYTSRMQDSASGILSKICPE